MILTILLLAAEAATYSSEKPLREATPVTAAFAAVAGAHSPAFTRDGKTVYFSAERPAHGRLPAHNVLLVSRFVGGQWTPPAWLEFSGQNQEGNIALSPDGSRMFFWSYRAGGDVESTLQQHSDIWAVERDGAGWGLPQRLPAPINTEARDYTGSFAADGTFYFSSTREGGKGEGDLYVARPLGKGFAAPENLGDAVNSAQADYAPAISPDGQTLVFSSGRPGGLGQWDLHVSFRKDGAWQPARNLGPRINSVFHDGSPVFSPDGRYLFFSSERSGKTQIYQVDTEALRELAAAEPHPYASLLKAVKPGSGCVTFSPDGKEAFFATPVPRPSRIMTARFENGGWTDPAVAGFSGRYSDGDPVFAADGRRLYFASDRPVDGVEQKNGMIWYVEKTAGGWSEPRQPGNTPAWRGSFASTTADGTVYFFSGGPDSRGAADVFRVAYRDGQYAGRENLGEAVNGRGSEVDPWVAPDESFLIFSSDRAGGMGRQDLYVSYRKDGRWGPPRSLGPLVNSAASEVCPCVSPDGRYFFYTSDRNNGEPAVFQVDLGLLKLGE